MPHDDLADSVRQFPAAMIGTVMTTEVVGTGPFGDEVLTRILVEKWVKADLGGVIDIRTTADGGAGCGLGRMDAGTRVGLLLTTEGDHLTTNLCLWVDADSLAEVDLDGDLGVPPMTSSEVRATWDAPSSPVARVAFLAIVGAAAGTALVVAVRRRRDAQVPE